MKNLMDQYKQAVQENEQQDLQNKEELWGKLEQKLDKQKQNTLPVWVRWSAAASLLLLCSVLGLYYLNPVKQLPVDVAIEDKAVQTEDEIKPDESNDVTIKPSQTPTQPQTELRGEREEQQTQSLKSDKPQQQPKTTSTTTELSKDVRRNATQSVATESPADELFTTHQEQLNRAETTETVDLGVITMETTDQLEEIVVTGYSTQKKSSFTGATRTVQNLPHSTNRQQYQGRTIVVDDAQALNGVDEIEETLSGTVSGVEILNVDQSESNQVKLRGFSSIKTNSEPLYIVDGVAYSAEEFAVIVPREVKGISVLKDGEASALYGNRASNGAIIINTAELTPKEKRKLNRANRKKNKDAAAIVPLPDATQIKVSNEEYEHFIENQFESPTTAPLSTFSVDVDRASYANIRRFLNMGQTVPKDAVRIEEMVNYFEYDYAQPKGNDPIAIHTEYSDAPWNSNHTLLKVGIQGQTLKIGERPPSNIVFLIDVSGSMSDQNKLPLLKKSVQLMLSELGADDKVSIVVYAGAAGVVLPPTNNQQNIIEALNKLDAGGSTAGGEGIELAYKIAQENFIDGGNNRVILATDGDFNVGATSNDDMEKLIEEKRDTGIFLTCLGYGMGNYKDSKLETLANKGNGNYGYIDNLQEANKVLVEEFTGTMFTIAKDVKVQIEFNPSHVKSYRLIGYENRKLRPEDFTNDAIDAGEIGAGHTVTALYEIIPVGVESNFYSDSQELKYAQKQGVETAFSDELATVKFRYKQPDGDTSKELVETIANQPRKLKKASPDFKFAAAVAWFGLKLRDSELVENKNTADIVTLAQQGKGKDADGYKAEFIRLAQLVE